uniref:NADH-ubiquinone oxidoreductase chain 2 n=1 Tax=Hemicaecilius mockfordi TaxID=2596999 RepID=A0A8K1ZFM1_9NEOP|nr:NADH dehydrogenase subunit 2 [Hemicaecilius mockfordi]
MLNNLNLLFLILMFSSSLLAASASSWLIAWMGLELNMLSFIPLLIEQKNSFSNESALKYFLIQAMASSMFIFLSITNTFWFFSFSIFNFQKFNYLLIPLLLKLGAAPFQAWFIMMMQTLNWWKALLLATWQKFAPLAILSYLNLYKSPLILISALSLTVGSLGGLNQTTFQKIFAFSSVSHLGWIFSSLLISKNLFFMYFLFYSFMNIILFTYMYILNFYFFNQNLSSTSHPMFFLGMLSLSGLPPFLGFIPKWMIIQHLTNQNHILMTFILIISALVNLMFYLRLIISASMLNSISLKWMNFKSLKLTTMQIMFTFSITILGLLLFNLLIM